MKKILSFFCIIGTLQCSFAQNTFPASGNAGIGTTNPSAELHLARGTIRVDGASPTLYLRGGASGEKGRITLNHYGHLSWDVVAGDAGNGSFSISPTGTSNSFVINS